MFDANVDEEEDDFNSVNNAVNNITSVHRCSMIKKYNIETFFSPAKNSHRRAATTESQPVSVRSHNETGLT